MKLNELDVRILDILAEQGELRGIEIAVAMGGSNSQTYARLAKLQRQGLISARWDYFEGRLTRYFKITGEGRHQRREYELENERPAPNQQLQPGYGFRVASIAWTIDQHILTPATC